MSDAAPVCDNCHAQAHDGWIVILNCWHYCCLDCLLRHRQSRLTRRAHLYVADLRRTEARP